MPSMFYEIFQEAKRRLYPSSVKEIHIGNQYYRLIHIVQELLSDPNFCLPYPCDRLFFWGIVETDFKRLDSMYGNKKRELKRSQKYKQFLDQLNQFDSERLYQLLTKYPYVVDNIQDKSYNWVPFVK